MELDKWMLILRCPLCRGKLQYDLSHIPCDSCGKTYPLRFGIPDFRLAPPEEQGYMSHNADLKVAAELFELHESHSFEELTHIKIRREAEHLNINQKLQDVYIQWRLENQPRAMKLKAWIQDQEVNVVDSRKETIGLDIGCGAGSGLATLLEMTDTAIGFDLSYSSLLLARSFIDENYPSRDYFLFAGMAECLPLANMAFSLILARDVIEHVGNQKKFLDEAHRIMRKGSSFVFNTGSRFVLLEPHTRLPFVGYLPRFLQPIYVRFIRRTEYKVHMPSLWELRKWLYESPFNNTWKIIPSKRIDPESHSTRKNRNIVHRLKNFLHRLRLMKLLNRLLSHISYYEVIVNK